MPNPEVPPVKPLQPHKTALIVGGSSGIGAALVQTLVENSYCVAVVARREAILSKLCEEVNQSATNSAKALYYSHNVADFDGTAALFQNIAADLGGLDLVVYAAGVQPPMSEDEYNFEKDSAMVNVNLLGAMAWLGLAAARFERAAAGHIVGISSIAADRGRRLNPGYNTSKAGLDTYLEALRNRLSRYGVTVTTIKPGFVDTRLLENAPRTMWVISPEEAAHQIYLAIEKRKQTVYIPKRWRFAGLVIRHMPSVIFRRLNI
jgi:decaprenylphospho-beta-D-erythro-pentofuranosid-2-ulose 2-reductase